MCLLFYLPAVESLSQETRNFLLTSGSLLHFFCTVGLLLPTLCLLTHLVHAAFQQQTGVKHGATDKKLLFFPLEFTVACKQHKYPHFHISYFQESLGVLPPYSQCFRNVASLTRDGSQKVVLLSSSVFPDNSSLRFLHVLRTFICMHIYVHMRIHGHVYGHVHSDAHIDMLILNTHTYSLTHVRACMAL